MIFFDTTKAAKSGHRSGLTRVSERLREELGAATRPVRWDGAWRSPDGNAEVVLSAADWLLTPEVFSPRERDGWEEFLARKSCRVAAIYHDAIPLKHPHITWPQSVARHPNYLKMLASFDRIFAVSRASRDELVAFWQWQGISDPPPVEVLALGADFNRTPRVVRPRLAASGPPELLCLGIIEPRKNQPLLLEVCAELWAEGLPFELHLVGRVNPHFGPPIVSQINQVRRRFPTLLRWHEAASDTIVAQLYTRACATAFPTIAEGCGLPLLESLWMGVPCIYSDLPVLRENGDGGGCLAVTSNDRTAWKRALKSMMSDAAVSTKLAQEARARPLPSWADTARAIETTLRSA